MWLWPVWNSAACRHNFIITYVLHYIIEMTNHLPWTEFKQWIPTSLICQPLDPHCTVMIAYYLTDCLIVIARCYIQLCELNILLIYIHGWRLSILFCIIFCDRKSFCKFISLIKLTRIQFLAYIQKLDSVFLLNGELLMHFGDVCSYCLGYPYDMVYCIKKKMYWQTMIYG